MLWFERLFPVLMLAAPGVITLCVRPHEQGDEPRARQLARGLWALTVVGLVLHAAAQALYELHDWPSAHLHRAWTTLFPLLGFMLLWFGLAGRVLAARHPGWRNTAVAPTIAPGASLTPPNGPPAAPRALLMAGWGLYALCVAGTVWAVVASANPLPLLGLAFWPGFAWGARMSRLEVGPADFGGSPELASECASFRRFKAGGFLICGMAGATLFAVTSVLMVTHPASAGLVGGAGGATLGLLGGAFGTWASLRRARIHARLAEQQRDTAGC